MGAVFQTNIETLERVDRIVSSLSDDDAILVLGMMNEIERLQKIIKQQEKRITDYGWSTNPDRSGGQFTIDEVNRSQDRDW